MCEAGGLNQGEEGLISVLIKICNMQHLGLVLQYLKFLGAAG